MQLIETKTLGAAAASIEFTSIPQDGTDLVVLSSLRLDNTTNTWVGINNAGSGHDSRGLFNVNGSVSSASQSNLAQWRQSIYSARSIDTANTFSSNFLYFPNYAGSTQKSMSADSTTESNSTDIIQTLSANLFTGTAAITTISFTRESGNFVAGSTISLYKITKGSDGIVTTS
jgi:hypothetical protein